MHHSGVTLPNVLHEPKWRPIGKNPVYKLRIEAKLESDTYSSAGPARRKTSIKRFGVRLASAFAVLATSSSLAIAGGDSPIAAWSATIAERVQ